VGSTDSHHNHSRNITIRSRSARVHLVYLNLAGPKNERLPKQYLKRRDINLFSELGGMNREKHQVSILHCTALQRPFRMPLASFVRHDGGARERGRDKGTEAQSRKAIPLWTLIPFCLCACLHCTGPLKSRPGGGWRRPLTHREGNASTPLAAPRRAPSTAPRCTLSPPRFVFAMSPCSGSL
jgi:hypothetical protein